MTGSHRVTAGLSIIVLLAAGIRLLVIPRQALWADEVFSIATATGHSLEQPAAQSQPSLGDYVELREPQLPDAYRAYLKNGPSAKFGLVMRAVLLSETNPPFYYLLLHVWLLLLGTSDFSLRLFSVLWSLACLPIIFLIGRRVGDVSTGLIGSLLFAFAPDSLFYSTEGRMYSLVWFLIVAYAYLMLLLYNRGVQWGWATLAVLTGTMGLLTHYFFIFPWLGCTFWLAMVGPDRTRRWMALALPLVTGILVSPWYIRIPASLGAWRITNGWLNLPSGRWAELIPRSRFVWLLTPVYLAWSFMSLRGRWIGETRPDLRLLDWLLLAFVIVVAGVAWSKLRKSFFTGQRGLLWLWFITSCLGPFCFDLLRHTYTSTIPRYALAGLPAAVLLLAIFLASMPRRCRRASIGVILVFWVLGDWQVFLCASRSYAPFTEIAHRIDAESPPPDLLVVHSLPSCILGLARYLRSNPPIFSWVEQLQQRTVPVDITRVAAGRHKVILVNIHEVGESGPEEYWLAAHSLRTHSENLEDAKLDIFELKPPEHGTLRDGAPVP